MAERGEDWHLDQELEDRLSQVTDPDAADFYWFEDDETDDGEEDDDTPFDVEDEDFDLPWPNQEEIDDYERRQPDPEQTDEERAQIKQEWEDYGSGL